MQLTAIIMHAQGPAGTIKSKQTYQFHTRVLKQDEALMCTPDISNSDMCTKNGHSGAFADYTITQLIRQRVNVSRSQHHT